MENKISPSFKVQWLNDTLKFIRNDNQLTMDYPKMPIAHVEYFYTSLCQREDHVGLGFKSLYSPLWEAMAASSEKYEFKIFAQIETNDMGQLVIKKIPKDVDDYQNKPVHDISKIPSLRSPKLRELIKQDTVKTMPMSTNSNSKEKPFMKQENKKVVKDEPLTENCENSLSELKLNETVRNKPKKKTKSQKYFEQTKKTIDSIAPVFFKTTFTKIYEFLNVESTASLTFSDLAPNEALFLQNFLGVYNRRAVLDIMFSPYCNDLLDKMAALFKEFDKQLKLDICVGKTDVKTSKREITFLKVPRYTKNTPTKAKLTYYVNVDLPSTSENQVDHSANKLLKALSKTTASTNETNTSDIKSNLVINTIDKKDLDKGTKNELSTIKKYAVKSVEFFNTNIQNRSAEKHENDVNSHNNTPSLNTYERSNIDCVKLIEIEKCDVNGTDTKKIRETCDSHKTIDTNTNKTNTDNKSIKNVMEKDIENKNIKIDSNESIDAKSIKITVSNKKLLNTDPNTNKTNTDNKSIKNVMEKDIENKNIKIDSNESIDAKSIKITVSNKKLLNTDNNNDKVRSVFLKDNNKKPIRKGISFEKANQRPDNESVTDENTDTVIEGVNRNRHNKIFEAMSTPLESDRAMRMMRLMGWEGGALGLRGEGITEPIIPAINITPGAGLGHKPLKSQKRQGQMENRLQFLHAILNLITNEDRVSELILNDDITKKEKRAFRDIICVVNSKKKLNLSKTGESELCEYINDKMADANIHLKVDYQSRRLIFKKTNISDTKENVNKTKKEKKIKTATTQLQTNTKTIKLPEKKIEFRILVLNKIINFITEEENRILTLRFDDILCVKHRKFVFNLCKSVNNRETFTNKNVPFHRLYFDLYENFTDYFDLHYGEDFQSFTIEKIDEYRELTHRNSKMKEKTETKKEINDNLNETSLESIVTVSEHKERHKKNNDTDMKDNNNNCNAKLLETKKDISATISKKNKSFIILIKLENGKNETDIFKLIVDHINQEINFLPHLKSHGVQNGYLVYSCYNKKSCLWLKNILSKHLDDIFIEYGGFENHLFLCMKISTKLNFKKILTLLEMYNPGINCMEWELWRPFCKKSLDCLIRVNYDSFDYVRNNHFKLHAGFDEIEFSLFIE